MPIQIQILDIAELPSLQPVAGVSSVDAQAFELISIPQRLRRYLVGISGTEIDPGTYVIKIVPEMGVELVSKTVDVTAEQAKQFIMSSELRGPAYEKFVVRLVKIGDLTAQPKDVPPTKKRVGKRRK